MHTTTGAALLLGLLAAAGPGELVEESWEAAHVEGARVGFVHTSVRKVTKDGAPRLRTSSELELTLRRYNTTVRLRREQGTEETPEGRVVGVFMRQGQEGGRQLVLTGALEDGRMHVRIDDGRIDRRLPWGDDVVGLYGLEHLFGRRRPKPGDAWALRRYDPTYNAVLNVQVVVKDAEEVALSPGAARERLLRVELRPERIEVPGVKVQPPAEVWWLDERFVPVRRQLELEGLGTVVLSRTGREAATTPAAAGRTADVGLKALVPLDRTLPRPYTTRAVVYRVTLRGDDDPASAFASDEHQEVRNVRGDTFELHVHPARRPMRPTGDAAPRESLESCHFLNSDDPRVGELARRAVGMETDPWAKARRIERWVKQSMRPDNAVPLGPAGDVARQLRGDCRQYALLTAALCRAAGVPSRTAVGLLYVEKGRRPVLGFHMWTEVWIDGHWLGLDATLGLGGVSAAHVKIADHSWHDTPSLTPLLPAGRVLGKVTVRVVSAE